MKNIIFIAPPGAGKGTQSDLLVAKYHYAHISTGDLLRAEVNAETPLGIKLKEIMASGALVSDDIVTELLEKRLSAPDIKTGFILDGYPRNLEQARILNEVLTKLGLQVHNVIYLDMDKEQSMHRALGRITCPKCHRGYNKYEEATKPQVEGLCDDCHVELVSRSDDNEETFMTRFDAYIASTQPLLKYYEDLGILVKIDNSGTPMDTFNQIEMVIKEVSND